MQMFAFGYLVLAVLIIYGTWLSYRGVHLRRDRVLRDRLTFMMWTMANQIPQGRPPATRPAPDALHPGGPAALQREPWQATRQADDREWKTHSKHRGMLLPGDYLSADPAPGRDRKSQPDTRPPNADPAQRLAKRTGLRAPRT